MKTPQNCELTKSWTSLQLSSSLSNSTTSSSDTTHSSSVAIHTFFKSSSFPFLRASSPLVTRVPTSPFATYLASRSHPSSSDCQTSSSSTRHILQFSSRERQSAKERKGGSREG